MSKSVNYKADKKMQKCIKELTSLSEILKTPKDLMLEIANQGVDIAKDNLSVYGVDVNGDLGQSIDAHLIDDNTAELSADGGHAIYVEFGAGIVGKQKPHKLAKEQGVEYNQGSQIVHFDDEKKDYWTYHNEKNGGFFQTHGQESKPFMYKTAIKLVRKSSSIIKNKIKELSKW